MDRAAWWATVHGAWDHKESDMTERLTHFLYYILILYVYIYIYTHTHTHTHIHTVSISLLHSC